METKVEKKPTAAEIAIYRREAGKIKKSAIRRLKINIFFFVLGAGAGFFGLTYFGALDINCLAQKGYVPQAIVKPYNGMILKVRARLNSQELSSRVSNKRVSGPSETTTSSPTTKRNIKVSAINNIGKK